MIDLGALKLSIAVDSKEAKQEIQDFTKESEGIKQSLAPVGAAAKTAALGIAAIGAAALGVVESTREYRTEQEKLQTAFETSGHSAEAAKYTYSSLNAVLGDSGQATEAANHLAKLCTTQEELSQWTDIATGVYATFGDSLPIEGLTEAANETAKTGSLTGALADALNWAGISEDDFQAKLDGCSTEQERQTLILDTLNGQYKEASDNYKENAADIIAANEANQKMTDAMALLGETLEPVITTFKNFIADGIEALAQVVANNKESIDAFLGAIKDFGNFIIDNKDIIISGLVGIGTGFAVFEVATVIQGVVTAIKAFQTANEGATIAQALLNAVMNTNPFILIASLIAGVIAALVTFVATNDEARAKIAEAWEAIKTFVSGAIDAIVGWFQALPEKFEAFKENFKNAAINLFQSLKDGFINAWDSITSWFSEVFGGIATTITGFAGAIYNAGKSIFTSLWDGLKSVWNSIVTWVSDKVSWLVDKLAFWRKGNDEMNSDGSHRTGLREVPYDGYTAELHKGEMVLTAAEANQYQKGKTTTTTSNVTVNNYSPKALNAADTAREYKKVQKQLSLGIA